MEYLVVYYPICGTKLAFYHTIKKRPFETADIKFDEHVQGHQDTDKSLVHEIVSPACDYQDHNQSTEFWRMKQVVAAIVAPRLYGVDIMAIIELLENDNFVADHYH